MEDRELRVNQIKPLLNMLMRISLESAEQAFELAKSLDLLDSQEVINWQDKLNFISINYK